MNINITNVAAGHASAFCILHSASFSVNSLDSVSYSSKICTCGEFWHSSWIVRTLGLMNRLH